jgi:hypothetical protein
LLVVDLVWLDLKWLSVSVLVFIQRLLLKFFFLFPFFFLVVLENFFGVKGFRVEATDSSTCAVLVPHLIVGVLVAGIYGRVRRHRTVGFPFFQKPLDDAVFI